MGYQANAFISLSILVLVTPLLVEGEVLLSSPSSLVIEPRCSTKCGNVTIPYPFGIEEGCNYDDEDNPDFKFLTKITCNHTFVPPKPILGENIPVTNISLEEGEIWISLGGVAADCYSEGVFTGSLFQSSNLVDFTISSTKNMFVATGCDTYAWFEGVRYGEPYSTGCMTMCYDLDEVVDNQCNGIGCCQSPIPDGVTNLTTSVYSFYNHTYAAFNPCSAAYPVAKDRFEFKKEDLTETLDFYSGMDEIPVVFNWGIGAKNCSVAQADGTCLCKSNTNCNDLKPDQDGYRCHCIDGFTGNPYLPQGCTCPKGYRGKATKTNGCNSILKTFIPVIVTAGTNI